MNKNELISVIIPSYNRKMFIANAVDSILQQSYKNVEIIIIDDGSIDGTIDYVKNIYKDKSFIKIYKNQKNMGAGKSRKIGYSYSTGEYIIFMDDDDYYTNYKFFEEAVKILKENPNISLVSSSSIIEYVKENRKEKHILNIEGEIDKAKYIENFQKEYMKSDSTFTTIFRRSNLESANFNEVDMVNDSCIYLRALLTGNAFILKSISGVYRVHSKNLTFNLTTDFINQNLVEKIKIYKEIKKRKLISNPDKWIHNQIELTINYFKQNNGKRKKVFILGYLRKNLGDDLFIKMLLEKYPIIDFYIKVPNNKFAKHFDKYENLNIIIGEDTDEELYTQEEALYDAYVYIGGSIFMEGGHVYNLSNKFYDFVKRCKEKNIPFCYISSNYGPYITKEYFDLSKENFKVCTDICFRDKYSYNLFKEIASVRCAPDFAFGYPINYTEKIKGSIGISIINLKIRDKYKELSDEYYNFLIKNIKRYISNGNVVYLYSFCEYEGDEEIVDTLLEYFKNEPEKVIGVKYRGNIDEFIETYSKMEYMICTRFHSMVLSCIARQKIYIISYSDKIDNVINDLKLDLPILNLKNINDNIQISKQDFGVCDEKTVLRIIDNSSKQDEKFREKTILE